MKTTYAFIFSMTSGCASLIACPEKQRVDTHVCAYLICCHEPRESPAGPPSLLIYCKHEVRMQCDRRALSQRFGHVCGRMSVIPAARALSSPIVTGQQIQEDSRQSSACLNRPNLICIVLSARSSHMLKSSYNFVQMSVTSVLGRCAIPQLVH